MPVNNSKDLERLEGAIFVNQDVPEIPGYIPSLNDIRIIHHPSAEREHDVYSFEEYCGQDELDATEENLRRFEDMDYTSPHRPWRPFASRIDFELAEVMLDAHMNGPQIEKVFDILRCITNSPRDDSGTNVDSQLSTHLSESLTLQNGSDLAQIWDFARQTRAAGVRTNALLIYSCQL